MQTGNQSFIKVDENSTQDKRDFKEVNLYEEVNFDLSKRMKEWLGDILNLKFTSILMLRTPANANSRWHCEGPIHTRQCALNFPVFGDAEVMEGQWATFLRFKNVDPVKMKSMVLLQKQTCKIQKYFVWDRSQYRILQHNDFPRGYNELSNIDRVVLSCAVEDFSDINVCYRKYPRRHIIQKLDK